MNGRGYYVCEILRTSKGDSKWWDTHELSLGTCISETSNNSRLEAAVMVISVGKRDREADLTKLHQALPSLMAIVNLGEIERARVLPLKKATTARSHTCRDLAVLTTSVQLKLSLSSLSEIEPACFKVETTYARSFSVKKRADSGERGRRKKEITPKTKVNRPSCRNR